MVLAEEEVVEKRQVVDRPAVGRGSVLAVGRGERHPFFHFILQCDVDWLLLGFLN